MFLFCVCVSVFLFPVFLRVVFLCLCVSAFLGFAFVFGVVAFLRFRVPVFLLFCVFCVFECLCFPVLRFCVCDRGISLNKQLSHMRDSIYLLSRLVLINA